MQEIKNEVYTFFQIREILFILPVSILIFRLFFSTRRASVFDIVALILLLVWKYYFCKRSYRRFPTFLIVSVFLYLLSEIISALLSRNQYWQLTELRRYVHVFMGGLLFTSAVNKRTGNILIALFLICGAIAGFDGIWQYWKYSRMYPDFRSIGWMDNSIIYAETMAVALGAVFTLFIKENLLSESKSERYFILLVIALMAAGILFSETRGVWLGLVVAVITLLFLHDRQKALFFLLASSIVLTVTFYLNTELRARATSIVTSAYTENEKGSTGARFELWKGALLIFRESPVLGVGVGNFEPEIKKLILEKKVKETPIIVHAHNIFLQVLATRGIVGFAIMLALFVSLVKLGLHEISRGRMGGFIIIFVMVFTMIAGLTEDNIEAGKYVAACCFTVGLIGASEAKAEEFTHS